MKRDTLSWIHLRFLFYPSTKINFSFFKADRIRSALAESLNKLCCKNRNVKLCKDCDIVKTCACGVLFCSNLIFPGNPGPLVLSFPDYFKSNYEPAEPFEVETILFGAPMKYTPDLIEAFIGAANNGFKIKNKNTKINLVNVSAPTVNGFRPVLTLDEGYLFNPVSVSVYIDEILPDIKLLDNKIYSVKLEFLSPFRAKVNNKFGKDSLEFVNFITSLLRRFLSVSQTYCSANIEVDFNMVKKLAKAVGTGKCETKWVELQRAGKRKSTQKYGGYVGEIEFKGPLKPFLNLLKVGEIIHAGSKTNFGFGQYEVIKIEELL